MGRCTAGIVIGLAVVGACIRLAGLGEFAFSPDDLMHLAASHGGSLRDVWNGTLSLIHPPLAFFLLRGLTAVTDDELLLRSIAWLPGLATIPALFFLGRRAVGVPGGVAMALLAAFGFAPVILSQVVRPYSLLGLLLVLAVHLAIRSSEEDPGWNLTGYCLIMTALGWLHYSTAIPLAGLGLAMGVEWLRRGRSARSWAGLVAAHVVPAVSVVSLYLYKTATIGPIYQTVRETYLRPYLPTSLGGAAASAVGLAEFFSLPGLAWPVMAASLLGLAALVRRGRAWLAVAVVATFAVNVALALLGKYPFGGIRHSFFLFPFVALLVGAAVDLAVVDGLAACPGRAPAWALVRGGRAGVTGALAIAALCAWVLVEYPKTRYLRRSPCAGMVVWTEFPLLRADHEALMSTLQTRMRDNDIVLASQQTSYYFIRAGGYRPAPFLAGNCKRVQLGRIESYFVHEWAIDDEAALLAAIRKVRPLLLGRCVGRIWVVNIGWGSLKGLIPASSRLRRWVVGETDPGGLHVWVLAPGVFTE